MFISADTRFTCGLITMASLLVSACGGGGGVSVDDGSAGDVLAAPLGVEAACPALSVSTAQAVPGARIDMSGLPDTMGEASIRVLGEDDAGASVVSGLLLTSQGDGSASFVVPLHPAGTADGGDVALELGDGLMHCPPQPFTILPLPQAPADYAETVQATLADWVRAQIRALGLDPDTLAAADADDLSVQEQALQLGLQFAIDADQDGSFAQQASAESADGDDLFERLLMASGLEAELQAQTDAANALTGTKLRPAAPVWKRHRHDDHKMECGSLEFPPRDIQINSAAELAARMTAVRNSTSRQVLGTLGTLFGSSEVANVGGTGGAFGKGNAVVFVVNTVNEARLASEPQILGRMTVMADTVMTEDRPDTSPGQWSAEITANGRAFNLAKASAQGIIQALGLVPGPVGTAATLGGFAFSNQINAELDRVTQDSCFRVRAAEYGPVDVTDERYTEASLIGSTIAFTRHDAYVPADIGATELQIDLKSEAFGSARTIRELTTVTVREQIISLLSSVTVVGQPGETVEISATVANSEDDPAAFTAETLGGRGTITNRRFEGDFFTVTVETPTERERYPVLVKFVSQNKTVPAGTPLRESIAEITLDPTVEISPSGACLLPGGNLALEATLNGFDETEQAVTWSASAGQIVNAQDLTATYEAPGSTQSVTITVRADADPSVEDSITVTVGSSCIKKVWYPAAAASIAGNGTYSPGGDGCPEDNHDEDQTMELLVNENDIYTPPDVPPENALWTNRSEGFSATYGHQSTRYSVDDRGNDDPSDDVCRSISLTGDVDADVNYQGQSDGTLAASFSLTGSGECATYAHGEVECVSPGLQQGLHGVFYTNITAETDMRLLGELRCENFQGNTSLGPLNIVMTRFEEGQTPFEPSEQRGTSIRDRNGNLRSPQLFSAQCGTGSQVIPIDVPFTLDAPAGTEDLIVFNITGAAFSALQAPANGQFSVGGDMAFSVRFVNE